MNKKKVLIIVGTLLAMALVAAILVLWLVPGNKTDAPKQTGSSAVTDEQPGDEVPGTTQGESDEPSVGVEVDVEVPGETGGNSGNSGNSGNGGNSGNSGNSGNTGNTGNNNEIDFDDLLGNG